MWYVLVNLHLIKVLIRRSNKLQVNIQAANKKNKFYWNWRYTTKVYSRVLPFRREFEYWLKLSKDHRYGECTSRGAILAYEENEIMMIYSHNHIQLNNIYRGFQIILPTLLLHLLNTVVTTHLLLLWNLVLISAQIESYITWYLLLSLSESENWFKMKLNYVRVQSINGTNN